MKYIFGKVCIATYTNSQKKIMSNELTRQEFIDYVQEFVEYTDENIELFTDGAYLKVMNILKHAYDEVETYIWEDNYWSLEHLYGLKERIEMSRKYKNTGTIHFEKIKITEDGLLFAISDPKDDNM